MPTPLETPDESTPNRWHRRKAARPQEIMDAALTLFTQKGFAATRLEEVALAAGVSKGTVYLYFESKEALFVAATRAKLVPLFELGESIIADFTGSAQDLLALLLRTWAENLAQSPNFCISKIMLSESQQFPEVARFYYEEVILRGRHLFATVVQRGMDSGAFQVRDAAVTAKILISPLVFFNVSQHAWQGLEVAQTNGRDFIENYIEFVMHGLGVAPSGTPIPPLL